MNAGVTPAVAPESGGRHTGGRRWLPDVLGVAWVVAAGALALLPALVHGASLGPFDLLAQYGLNAQHGVVVHNKVLTDQIDEMIPWASLAWTQVHHGHLPLWNPYSALGMPLAFNWQSATFSVPALIGYVFPLRLVFTVQVIVTLLIAGTGVYVLGRVLRLSVLACAFAGTVFELSGPLFGWLGWPIASVASWSGWLFAGAILVVRARHRARSITWFALALAFAVYAGQPHALILLALALAVFLVVLLVQRLRALGGSGPILRPVVDLAVASVAGVALAAPLALPGYQLTGQSVRQLKHALPVSPQNTFTQRQSQVLALHDLTHLLFQSFDGLPLSGSQWFGDHSYYIDSAAYVGVIALVLAVAAVAWRRRRPVVIAFGAVALAMLGVAFVAPLVTLLDQFPDTTGILWHRSLLLLVFALSVLAGVGLDVLIRSPWRRTVWQWMGGGFAAVAVVLLAVWAVGRGNLPPVEASIRAKSFIWPAVETAIGLGVVGTLLALHHRRGGQPGGGAAERRVGRWVGVVLLGVESVFLVVAAEPLFSSSPTFFATTPAIAALVRDVGSSEVGVGAVSCSYPSFEPFTLGILPEANVSYGIKEFAFYDPLAPQAYFSSWKARTGSSGGYLINSIFCPAVTTARLARLYGVAFVLEPSGRPGPQGGVFDARIGNEVLYRIPGAAAATLTPTTAHGALPGLYAAGTPVAVTTPGPASVTLVSAPTVSRCCGCDSPTSPVGTPPSTAGPWHCPPSPGSCSRPVSRRGGTRWSCTTGRRPSPSASSSPRAVRRGWRPH